MDKERQIRFLYPSFTFLLSLVLGASLDVNGRFVKNLSDFTEDDNLTTIIVALFGLGSLVFVLGYLIGTISLILLRIVFFFNRFSYEFVLSDKTYKEIGKLILKGHDKTLRKKEKMYAAVVFDHSYINERVHSWIIRRWNAFLIASFSVVSLAASLIFGKSLGIAYRWGWTITVIIFMCCLILQAILSYVDTMRMITFLTRVNQKVKPDTKNFNSDLGEDD